MFFLLFSTKAQDWCDSTYAFCDSIYIDSISFTSFPSNGERIHVHLTTDHDFLHGPTFVLCPENENVSFVDDAFGFFGLVGPMSVTTWYEFNDITTAGDNLAGHIVVDNSNNPFENCMIGFNVEIPDLSVGVPDSSKDVVILLPNPSSSSFQVSRRFGHLCIFNAFGRLVLESSYNPEINISHLPQGVYLVRVDGTVIKLMKN
jgi:hypothetical protein